MKKLIQVLLTSILLCGCTPGDDGLLADFDKEVTIGSETEADSIVQDTSIDIAATETAEGSIFVHVCGAVVSPGVYELKSGSRAYEALDMAGGPSEDAAVYLVNLAEVLFDTEKLYIPSINESYEVESSKDTQTSIVDSNKVNINTATLNQLMTLSGIGEAKAEAIIAYREANGPFESIEGLMLVNGIKEAAFQKIKDSITV